MNFSDFLPLIATYVFGTFSILLSLRVEKQKKSLLDRERVQKQRIYEISILKEIQDRIGYELDIEKVTDVITGSLRGVFPYTSASSLFTKGDHLVLKTYLDESVGTAFIEEVKKNMLASLGALSETELPTRIHDTTFGAIIDKSNMSHVTSFFHIPLFVGSTVVGIITISSTKPAPYTEDEMTLIYRITGQASSALTKLQEVLTREKGKLMATIKSLSDGVFMVDTNNQLLLINDAAKNLLKINKDTPTIVDILASLEHYYGIGAKLEEAMQKRVGLSEKEVAIDGKLVEIFVTPVVDTLSANIIGASVLLSDVTLEHNLTKMKEDFTHIIVHELRAPLTAIRGAAKLINSGTVKPTDEDAKKLLSIMEKQSTWLLDEVGSLLDVAKIESGRFTVEKMPTDIKPLVIERIEFFDARAKEVGLALVADIPDNLPKISLDAFRMTQVFNNLLSNSIKFTDAGGKITITASVHDGSMTVWVTDTGHGIPKEKQSTLFSKFSQVVESMSQSDPSSSPINNRPGTHDPGTGLGLYIVKGIVEAHGGKVTLESEMGKGTTISFTIPLT